MIPAILERCAGIDVHKKFLMVCRMIGAAAEEPKCETRRFETITADLRLLKAWLHESGCTHVVMESTGSYWRPVFNVLEDGLQVVLANPQHVKNLRGHKTDRNDARWLAHLLRHGMIRPSFIPPRDLRELRDLTRRRRQLVRTGSAERNRVERVLVEANIQIGNVLSDVFGASGQAMVDALLDGQQNVDLIAQLARGAAKKKIPALQAALEGHTMSDHHRKLIRCSLRHMAFLEEEVADLDREIQAKIEAAGLRPKHDQLQHLHGIKVEAAACVLAELGPEPASQFPGPAQAASWAGVCPGNNESAGKRKSSNITRGNPWLRATMIECAWSASRTKNSYFRDLYTRLAPKIGHKRAIVAVAHALLIATYQLLTTGEPCHAGELEGAENKEMDETKVKRCIRHHSRRLRTLGRYLRKQRSNASSSAEP